MNTDIKLKDLIGVLVIVAMGLTLAWSIPRALETKTVELQRDSVSLRFDEFKHRTDSLAPIHAARDQRLEELSKRDSLKDQLYDSQINAARVMLPADKRKLLADRERWFRERFDLPK